MAEKTSIRGFAKTLGVSHTAVQVAIKAGRLKKSVGKGADGKPYIKDSALAQQEWASNTDQSKPRNIITGDPKHRRDPAAAPAAASPRAAALAGGGGGGGAPTYADSRAIREAYMARLARVDYEEKIGKLINADEVKVAAFNAARKARDALLVIPDRLSPILAGMKDDREIHRVLTEEIRRVCDELGRAKIAGG